MKRFDAAIIGSGPEGLIAAITLARAGLDVVVLEKNPAVGGRAETREFHPGFRASLYADELPAIPARLFRVLDLARNGAVLVPGEASLLVSEEGHHLLFSDPLRAARAVSAADRDGFAGLARDIAAARAAIDVRAAMAPPPRTRSWLARWKKREAPAPWGATDWGQVSLDDCMRARIANSVLRLHLAADAVMGRAVSPFLAGTALHLLAPGAGRSGMAAGGLGSLALALGAVAQAAGVTLRCGVEVTDIEVKQGRATGLALAGGEEVKARFILSTLDVKRTFLSLVAWNALSREMLKRVGQYRMAGAAARILFALDAAPELALASEARGVAMGAALGPIHVVDGMETLSQAHETWRAGVLPENPPVTLRVPSSADPRLAPVGKAVMTATISAVPMHLFDGPWNDAKRDRLKALALHAAERAFPGVAGRVLAAHVLIGDDIETALGCTLGDLEGGELAPDQILGLRPFQEWSDGRTAIAGLYLGGPSSAPSPFFCGLAGERAARALLADAARDEGAP